MFLYPVCDFLKPQLRIGSITADVRRVLIVNPLPGFRIFTLHSYKTTVNSEYKYTYHEVLYILMNYSNFKIISVIKGGYTLFSVLLAHRLCDFVCCKSLSGL